MSPQQLHAQFIELRDRERIRLEALFLWSSASINHRERPFSTSDYTHCHFLPQEMKTLFSKFILNRWKGEEITNGHEIDLHLDAITTIPVRPSRAALNHPVIPLKIMQNNFYHSTSSRDFFASEGGINNRFVHWIAKNKHRNYICISLVVISHSRNCQELWIARIRVLLFLFRPHWLIQSS